MFKVWSQNSVLEEHAETSWLHVVKKVCQVKVKQSFVFRSLGEVTRTDGILHDSIVGCKVFFT